MEVELGCEFTIMVMQSQLTQRIGNLEAVSFAVFTVEDEQIVLEGQKFKRLSRLKFVRLGRRFLRPGVQVDLSSTLINKSTPRGNATSARSGEVFNMTGGKFGVKKKSSKRTSRRNKS